MTAPHTFPCFFPSGGLQLSCRCQGSEQVALSSCYGDRCGTRSLKGSATEGGFQGEMLNTTSTENLSKVILRKGEYWTSLTESGAFRMNLVQEVLQHQISQLLVLPDCLSNWWHVTTCQSPPNWTCWFVEGMCACAPLGGINHRYLRLVTSVKVVVFICTQLTWTDCLLFVVIGDLFSAIVMKRIMGTNFHHSVLCSQANCLLTYYFDWCSPSRGMHSCREVVLLLWGENWKCLARGQRTPTNEVHQVLPCSLQAS